MSEKAITKPAKGKKLTVETIKIIVEMYKNTEITQRNLAEQFDISKSSLNRLLKANKVTIRKEDMLSKSISFDLLNSMIQYKF